MSETIRRQLGVVSVLVLAALAGSSAVACGPKPAIEPPAVTATPSALEALSLQGRLIVDRPGQRGRHTLLSLDVDSGRWQELWVASEDDTTFARRWALAPDGRRLAYAFTARTAVSDAAAEAWETTIVVRALEALAPALQSDPLPENASVTGIHWVDDGKALLIGVMYLSDAVDGKLQVPAGFELQKMGVGDDREPSTRELIWRLEAPELEGNLWILAAVDSAAGAVVLLGGPGENGYLDTIRVLDMDRERVGELARWQTGGEAYRFARGPRAGRPGASLLAVVDERAQLEDPEQPASIKLVDPERLDWVHVADVAPDRRASDLLWSPEGDYLIWTESPMSGTGMRQKLRFARIDSQVGRPAIIEGAEGQGAVALAFSPRGKLDQRPTLLTGDGIFRLVDDDGASQRFPLPWTLPTPHPRVYPQHAFSSAGHVIGWVP